MRRRPARGGDALSDPIDPRLPPPRRLLRGAEQLRALIDRRLLVGITYVDRDGEVMGREQFCGRVIDVGEGVVVVERPGEPRPAVLPADEAAYEPAPAGRYTLADSGEIVVDPDWLTTWMVRIEPPAGDDGGAAAEG